MLKLILLLVLVHVAESLNENPDSLVDEVFPSAGPCDCGREDNRSGLTKNQALIKIEKALVIRFRMLSEKARNPPGMWMKVKAEKTLELFIASANPTLISVSAQRRSLMMQEVLSIRFGCFVIHSFQVKPS